MNTNFLNTEKIKDNLENIAIFIGMIILYYNIYLYICIMLSIINTKLLIYFYSNFDNINIDLTFSCKKPQETIEKNLHLHEEFEKISESSKEEDNISEMGKSVIFSNDEDDMNKSFILSKDENVSDMEKSVIFPNEEDVSVMNKSFILSNDEEIKKFQEMFSK